LPDFSEILPGEAVFMQNFGNETDTGVPLNVFFCFFSIWKDRNIKTATKIKVMKSVVWAVFQYGVEGWTLKKSDRNRIEAFEMWCWRKMLSISWQEHRTNDSILTELGL